MVLEEVKECKLRVNVKDMCEFYVKKSKFVKQLGREPLKVLKAAWRFNAYDFNLR